MKDKTTMIFFVVALLGLVILGPGTCRRFLDHFDETDSRNTEVTDEEAFTLKKIGTVPARGKLDIELRVPEKATFELTIKSSTGVVALEFSVIEALVDEHNNIMRSDRGGLIISSGGFRYGPEFLNESMSLSCSINYGAAVVEFKNPTNTDVGVTVEITKTH